LKILKKRLEKYPSNLVYLTAHHLENRAKPADQVYKFCLLTPAGNMRKCHYAINTSYHFNGIALTTE